MFKSCFSDEIDMAEDCIFIDVFCDWNLARFIRIS